MTDPSVIVWFRRELRLQDNLAIKNALDRGQKIIPLFIFDPAILHSKRLGVSRLKFMLEALKSLSTELHKHQRELLVKHGEPLEVIRQLIGETGASALYFNIDYTPYARKRDQAIMETMNIEIHIFHDRLLAHPHDIEKNDGGPYVVYTPFKNKWRKLIKPEQDEIYDILAENLHTLEGLANNGIPSPADLDLNAIFRFQMQANPRH